MLSIMRGRVESRSPLDETNTPPPIIKETGFIIDIQYTMPGSWILWVTGNENVGSIIESNRTETEDGWFVVSFTDSSTQEKKIIKYRFKDGNRDVLECLVDFLDSSGNSEENIQCILIRILESRALTITT